MAGFAFGNFLVQEQKTCSGMVGATFAVAQGRRKADPYSGNPAHPICVCTSTTLSVR